MYFKSWRMNLRLVAGVCSALLAIGGFAGALASYGDYAPATRGYAKAAAKKETDTALMVTTARIGNLQRESNETRLQINQLRLETLRGSRWSLSDKLKSEPDAGTRQFLQAQLDLIDDDLRDVNKERDQLRASSP
jgi:hypothetical protein